MAHMNKYVVDFEPNTYADEGGQECKVDCSLGVNLEELPQKVIGKLKELSPEHLKNYPHGEEVLEALLGKLNKLNPALSEKNIAVGCGSVDILRNLNELFIGPGKKVVGVAPQFSAYIDDIRMKGSEYIASPMKKENGYQVDIDDICTKVIENRPDLVYIDNPNNPTGQIFTREELERIWKAADSVDAAIIVDEAYGDYMPEECSIIDKVGQWNGLVVTKTMSKGYGMAGMRMGYVASQEDIIYQLNKLLIPFNCNSLARDLAIAMLTDDDYLDGLVEMTEDKNMRIKASVGKAIKVAKTEDCVPISLLYTEDETVDLARVLSKAGVAAVSGAGFDGIGINSIRLMVPAESDMDLLCELLAKADSSIE